jgi:flagellin-like hook-associated protein FlgL
VPPRAGDSVVLSARPEGTEAALLVASFIFSVAVYASLPKPEITAVPTDSPNNRLAGQTNIARVYQAIPDVYGQRRVWPDLIQQTLIEYVDNLRTLTEWLCVSRGIGDVDVASAQLSSWRSRAGESLNRLDSLESRLSQARLDAQTERSLAEDLDMLEAISDFQNRQSGYDAALKTYSIVQQMSLFEYLR